MPNVRQKGKRIFNLWVPMELHAQFANAAKAKGMSMSELMVKLMQREAAGFTITDAQLKDINERMKNAAVTPADVATAVAENIAKVIENQAAHALRPTLRGIELNALPELTPIPKLGSSKKKRR